MAALRKFYMLIILALLVSLPVCATTKAKSSPAVKAPVVQVPVIKTTTIEGQGFLKTRGGDIKTCSGEAVYLYTIHNYEKFIMKEQSNRKINKLGLYTYYEESFQKYKDNRKMYDFVLKNINNAIYEMRTNYPDLNITGVYDDTQYYNDMQKIREYENNKISKAGEASLFTETMCDASGNFIFHLVCMESLQKQHGIVLRWEVDLLRLIQSPKVER